VRHLRFLFLSTLIVGLWSVLVPTSAGAQSLDEIAQTIDRDGLYAERDLQSVALDAVDRANADDVGFVYLDQENADDLPIIATGLLDRLEALGSNYRTLIVLDTGGVWVQSLDRDTGRAADAATPEFANGAVAGGIDAVLTELGGGSNTAGSNTAGSNTAGTETTGSAGAETGGAADPAASSSSGGGVPWLLIILLGALVFFVVLSLIHISEPTRPY